MLKKLFEKIFGTKPEPVAAPVVAEQKPVGIIAQEVAAVVPEAVVQETTLTVTNTESTITVQEPAPVAEKPKSNKSRGRPRKDAWEFAQKKAAAKKAKASTPAKAPSKRKPKAQG